MRQHKDNFTFIDEYEPRCSCQKCQDHFYPIDCIVDKCECCSYEDGKPQDILTINRG